MTKGMVSDHILRPRQIAALLLLLLAAAATCPAQEQSSGRRTAFEFAAIGDQGYDAASEARFPAIMREMNRAKLAFVVHVGDFMAGNTACTDELFLKRRIEFDGSAHPFIYTPGDNEWTDCRAADTQIDPLERLNKLRELFFPPRTSLGRRRTTLARQSSDAAHRAYIENAYWVHNGVMFATLHIVGSNNNRRRQEPDNSEYQQRTAANIAWMRKVFARARQLRLVGVVIVTQANPVFARVDEPEDPERPSGFRETLQALRTETLAFPGPVLFIHGDTHTFRLDQPLLDMEKRSIERFTRLEVFGWPHSHWVRIRVDPRSAQPFSFTPRIVGENTIVR